MTLPLMALLALSSIVAFVLPRKRKTNKSSLYLIIKLTNFNWRMRYPVTSFANYFLNIKVPLKTIILSGTFYIE